MDKEEGMADWSVVHQQNREEGQAQMREGCWIAVDMAEE